MHARDGVEERCSALDPADAFAERRAALDEGTCGLARALGQRRVERVDGAGCFEQLHDGPVRRGVMRSVAATTLENVNAARCERRGQRSAETALADPGLTLDDDDATDLRVDGVLGEGGDTLELALEEAGRAGRDGPGAGRLGGGAGCVGGAQVDLPRRSVGHEEWTRAQNLPCKMTASYLNYVKRCDPARATSRIRS